MDTVFQWPSRVCDKIQRVRQVLRYIHAIGCSKKQNIEKSGGPVSLGKARRTLPCAMLCPGDYRQLHRYINADQLAAVQRGPLIFAVQNFTRYHQVIDRTTRCNRIFTAWR